MKTKNAELKVGIFIVLGIVILSLGYLWLKQAKFKSRGYIVMIDFNDATGLQKGDPVRVLGVDKGKVRALKLKEDMVSTRCYVEGDVILKKDAKATIKDVALISGSKYIELDKGKEQELFDIAKPLIGKGSPSFSLGELGDILGPIRKIAEKLSQGDIEKTLENINTASNELAQLIKENRDGIKRTVRNAESDIKKAMVIVDKLDKNVDLLSETLEGISKGKGTMGKIIKDEKLYNEMESTLKETKALIKDIKENPNKYINIKVF